MEVNQTQTRSSTKVPLLQNWRFLILGPAIFSIIFLAILSKQLLELEKLVRMESSASTVTLLMSQLRSELFQSVLPKTEEAASPSPLLLGNLQTKPDTVNRTYDTLKAILADNPNRIKSLELLQETQNQVTRLASNHSDNNKSNTENMDEIQVLLKTWISESDKFNDEDRQVLNKVAESLPAARGLVVALFIFGALLLAAASIWLSFHFKNSVQNRMAFASQNAKRLFEHNRLEPPLSGADDIAELDSTLHKIEAWLTDARRKERAMIDNAVDVICTIDATERFETVSPSAVRVLGYTPEQLIGKTMQTFAADNKSLATALLDDKSKDHLNFESQWLKPDGSTVDLLWSAHWSVNQKALFCIAHDISDRKRAEQLLKEGEERIRLIMESMPVGVLVLNERGNIEFANATFRSLTMFDQEPNANYSITQFITDDERDLAETSTSFLVKTQKFLGRSTEMNMTKSNGEVFPIELSMRELTTRQGRRFLTTIMDITERQEVDRLKREFVAMITHDLKTPLAALKGTIALFAAGAFGTLNENGQKTAERADYQITRLLHLVNDLLDLEKMKSGRFELEIIDTSLDDVISNSIEAVRRIADQRKIRIEYAHTDIKCDADGARLIQVMVNLLSNAIKFSSTESKIDVLVEELDKGIKVSIRDYGRGIPKEYQRAIFEKFEQVEKSDSLVKGGTGLGLSIARQIIEQHNGHIDVASELGQGTTFWFIIPKTNQPSKLTKSLDK